MATVFQKRLDLFVDAKMVENGKLALYTGYRSCLVRGDAADVTLDFFVTAWHRLRGCC
jgi:hypothetical protein